LADQHWNIWISLNNRGSVSEIDANNDSTAASPGAILKRCREYHDISLEEAAEATKVGENYLKALEDEQLREFASLAYLKGFLRIYATYLNLNPDDMIRLYEKLYGTNRNRNGLPAHAGVEEAPPRNKFPLQKLAMPVFFLILILITSAIVNRSPSSRPLPPIPSPAVVPAPAAAILHARSSAGQNSATQKPVEVPPEQQRSVAVPADPNAAGKRTAENSRGFIVRMKVLQSGTLAVTIDGSASQAYELVVGDNIEWKADRSIYLELSNAGGVEAELNGRPLKPFGQSGKPAVVVLDADGVRQ
jgi:cytoskeletal protein RodZ